MKCTYKLVISVQLLVVSNKNLNLPFVNLQSKIILFQFKQFTIQQDRCAMKIGTDGVLLGAWTPIVNNPFSILDIGTGTGIIALMLSQRSYAEQIDALEIDEDAYEQSVDNFENSPWSDRLFCFHAGLDEFVEEPEDEYDLIVSNPPFYTDDFKSANEQRDLARFADAMPFEDLIEAADLLLSENGIFAVIIPFKEEENFLKQKAIDFKTNLTNTLNKDKNELIISSEKNKIKTIKNENILDEIIKLKNEKIELG